MYIFIYLYIYIHIHTINTIYTIQCHQISLNQCKLISLSHMKSSHHIFLRGDAKPHSAMLKAWVHLGTPPVSA